MIQPPQPPAPVPALVPAAPPAQLVPSHPAPPHRPLSSAEETGPIPKKPRSTTRKVVGTGAAETKVVVDDDAKKEKARARPALHIVNFISSSLGQSKVAPARTVLGASKGDREATRRSTRLLGGNTRSNVKVSLKRG
jgi:anaphase-promoting complex subunit 3